VGRQADHAREEPAVFEADVLVKVALEAEEAPIHRFEGSHREIYRIV
jgi:hypothetical protein